MKLNRKLSGHAAASLMSQAMNSITSLAVAVLVAHVAVPSIYGQWATVYASFVFILQCVRALVSTQVLIHRDVHDSVPIDLLHKSLSFAFTAGLISGICLLPIAFFMSRAGIETVIVVACATPFMVLQDTIRYIAFRNERGSQAAMLDGLWVLIQGVLSVCLIVTHHASVALLTAVWCLGAVVPATAWIIRHTVRLTVGNAHAFFRENRRSGAKLLIESILGTGVLQLVPALLAITAGYEVAGGVRAGQTLFGTATFLVMGITPLMTTAAVKRERASLPVNHLLVAMTIAIGAVAAIGLLIFTFVPAIGHILTGKSWDVAHSIIVPSAVATGLRGVYAGVPIIFRARNQLTEVVHLRMLTTVPALLCPVLGGIVHGLIGAAWGIAFGTLVNCLQSLRALARHSTPTGKAVSRVP